MLGGAQHQDQGHWAQPGAPESSMVLGGCMSVGLGTLLGGDPAGAGEAWRHPEVPQASAGLRRCDHNHIGHVLYVTYVVNSQLAKLNKSLNEF